MGNGRKGLNGRTYRLGLWLEPNLLTTRHRQQIKWLQLQSVYLMLAQLNLVPIRSDVKYAIRPESDYAIRPESDFAG